MAFALVACSSSPPQQEVPSADQAYTGKVFITEEAVPEGVAHVVIPEINASTKKTRFSSGKSTYPLLADEARRVGANAVVSVEGGRRVDSTAWTADYASGQAIRIDGVEALKTLPGGDY